MYTCTPDNYFVLYILVWRYLDLTTAFSIIYFQLFVGGRIYVICVCLHMVVSNTYCVVLLFCLFYMYIISQFLDEFSDRYRNMHILSY
jgi:hypothetical protein